MLRILLADDHDLTRAGLRYLLEKQKDWSVCGEAPNGRAAVELAEELRPDVAILDMSMPELNGVEATRQILKKLPRTKILIYTMHETEAIIIDALNAGASGIVLKSDAGENMVTAVESVVRGRRFFTPHVAETVVEAYLTKKTGTASDPGGQVVPRGGRELAVVFRVLADAGDVVEVPARVDVEQQVQQRVEVAAAVPLVAVAVGREGGPERR